MIPLTRLNGTGFGLNPDAVVRADVTPDTVLTLADGSKYVVAESLDEVVDRVVAFRAAIIRRSTEEPVPVAGPDPLEESVEGQEPSTVVPLRPRRA